jgi:hypothetical protein
MNASVSITFQWLGKKIHLGAPAVMRGKVNSTGLMIGILTNHHH